MLAMRDAIFWGLKVVAQGILLRLGHHLAGKFIPAQDDDRDAESE